MLTLECFPMLLSVNVTNNIVILDIIMYGLNILIKFSGYKNSYKSVGTYSTQMMSLQMLTVHLKKTVQIQTINV